MKLNMDTLEKERDFYFAKLRDIEVLLQTNNGEENALGANVLKILYASEEEKVEIDDNGKLTITPLEGEVEGGIDLLKDDEDDEEEKTE